MFIGHPSFKKFIIYALMIMVLLQIACSRNPVDLLEEANNHYKAGDAAQATRLYKEILSRQKKPLPTRAQLFESEFKLILCNIMQDAPDMESDIKKLHEKYENNLDLDHYKIILDTLLDKKKTGAWIATIELINDRYPDNKKLKEMISEQLERLKKTNEESLKNQLIELARTVGSYS